MQGAVTKFQIRKQFDASFAQSGHYSIESPLSKLGLDSTNPILIQNHKKMDRAQNKNLITKQKILKLKTQLAEEFDLDNVINLEN